ncbi:hypothetical protein IFR05_001676 [Cadophora sp. M221]|nr:hypothetical protein IFR05_001676 [Cadophora sp. M221]
MCTSIRAKSPKAERASVAVFDLNSNHLEKFPKGVLSEKSKKGEEEPNFEKAKIPRFGLFDIFASNEVDEITPPSHTIITRASQDTKGSSFVARLNYGRLGAGANIKRAFTSSRHRVIYIGSVLP